MMPAGPQSKPLSVPCVPGGIWVQVRDGNGHAQRARSVGKCIESKQTRLWRMPPP